MLHRAPDRIGLDRSRHIRPLQPRGLRMSMFGLLRGPRQVLFGAGQRHALGSVAASLGSRAFVVTDARFGATPEFAALLQVLERSGVSATAWTEALPDAPVEQVHECLRL